MHARDRPVSFLFSQVAWQNIEFTARFIRKNIKFFYKLNS
jgi:hypothetical protein